MLVKANECPKCGGPLDKTMDAEHYAWHVTYDECNRCESVAFHQAKKDGASDAEAHKQAAPAGRLWKAAAALPKKP
jgi:ssDNA-binding Zn-finger/Zn-ribbon topoisomerase 1